MAFGSAGVALVPGLMASCATSQSGRQVTAAASASENLLYNGDFSLSDPSNPRLPSGWQTGPGESVGLSQAAMHSGEHSVLQRRTGDAHYHYYLRQEVDLEAGGLYRLRFHLLADEKASDMVAVCLSCQGEEGPAWLYEPVEPLRANTWQEFDLVFRARSGFNPLHRAQVEFRLYQWRPAAAYRPAMPPERGEQQLLYIDSASLVKVEPGSRVPGRLSGWLSVPGHEDLRMAELQRGLGDGLGMVPGSLELNLGGRTMRRVDYLEQVRRAGEYALSERSDRIYVRVGDASGDSEVSYRVQADDSGDAALGRSTLPGRALGRGRGDRRQVSLQMNVLDFDRENWPVTQGISFPQGELSEVELIRVLDARGRAVDCQVTPCSYWADDSLRWVLLDFCVNIASGASAVYRMEYGPGVRAPQVSTGIAVEQEEDVIRVDAGRVTFSVSRDRFRLLEDLKVDGRAVLAGPAALRVSDGEGRVFRADRLRPYSVAVEESGPMRSVVAVHGWNGDEEGEKFLTYTLRIHAYYNQPFVKVFCSLTNRHSDQESLPIRYTDRREPLVMDGGRVEYRNLPGVRVSDATLELPLSAAREWSFACGSAPGNRGRYGPLRAASGDWDEHVRRGRVDSGGVLHRQQHHEEGFLRFSGSKQATEYVPGVVRVESGSSALTAAVYRYSNLFPREVRINGDSLELGLMAFNTYRPHALLMGNARTSEILLYFGGSEAEGMRAGRSFTEPTVFSNADWYCAGRGFMGDPLVPANRYTSGTYDRIIDSYVENNVDPFPPGVDDCGMANYGDFRHSMSGGYNDWLNLEYDGDLGLYMYFARTSDRRSYLRAIDGSRHFLDSDTGWYTGSFNTHGGNYSHNVAHFNPTTPGGHLYTLGLIHYYVLSGDRRALEATRMASDCAIRVLYHRARVLASIRSQENIVGPQRSHHIPGGSGTSVDSRNFSDPARYLSHAYLVTGEARFIDSCASLCEALVKRWPRVWRKTEDYYIHYRWQQVLGRIYEMTGGEHLRDILVRCGEWTLEEPYAEYGEFRVAQSYGRGPQLPGRTNNTRNLYLTFWAWRITGERRYLDWMVNMFDAQVERMRHEEFNFRDGKSLGKEADNPARGLAWIAPYRTVLVEPDPERFHVVPPWQGTWTLAVGNTSETPLRGRVQVGPLPQGVRMQTDREFSLELLEEVKLEFGIEFDAEVASGRLKIPYRVTTEGRDGRQGERNGFFAAHVLRERSEEVPRLLFHAPMDDASAPYAVGGSRLPVLEREDFIEGRLGRGRAFGPNSEGWSFDASGSIFADAGTISLWMKPTGSRASHSSFRVRGYGWLFLGVFSQAIYAGPYHLDYPFFERAGEWLHIALRWDINTVTIYIDGREVKSFARTHYEIPTGVIWGQPMDTAGYDDLRIYSVPLAEDRIAALSRGEDVS